MDTSIPETFRNGTVLVTGSTGFLGKLLTEKLLRSCPVKTVAVLVRSKKGSNALQRVADIYEQNVSISLLYNTNSKMHLDMVSLAYQCFMYLNKHQSIYI